MTLPELPPKDDHAPNVRHYVLVFAALLLLTLTTVFISKLHLPRHEAITLGLFVAAIKGGLVAAVFMHLWGEAKMIIRALAVVIACAAMLVIPIIEEYLIRPRLLYPVSVGQQHPDEGAAQNPAESGQKSQ